MMISCKQSCLITKLQVIFSTVKKILTNSRHNLGNDVKKGHAHSSVYEDRTGIGNNLVGLLITKINAFKQHNIKCFEWQPSKAMMKDAKSVTYKNLSPNSASSKSLQDYFKDQ